MIGLPDSVRVYLEAGRADLRRGIDGPAAQIRTTLHADPFCGHVSVFPGRVTHAVIVLRYGDRAPDTTGGPHGCCTEAGAG
jgi:hypothetical protein